MLTREENVLEAKKSSYTEEDVEQSYKKGLKVGRIEGMIAYQQRIIKNLQADNENLNTMLKEAVK